MDGMNKISTFPHHSSLFYHFCGVYSSLFYQKVVSLHADVLYIQQTYYDDFAKYANKVEPILLRNTLQSVILLIGGKFMYSKVKGGYRADDVKKALQMLCDAGIVKRVSHTAANGCKAGTSGKMKSLRLFMRNKHLNDAYRCSLENFALLENQDVQDDNAVRRIAINPLYAISNLCK